MIVFLTTSDTDILTVEGVRPDLPSGIEGVLALNPYSLAQDDEAFGHFLDETLTGASLVMARLLGGENALGDNFPRLAAACRRLGIPLVACSGEPTRDAVFERRSTTPAILAQTAFEYLNHGGVVNTSNLLRFLSDEVLGTSYGYSPPAPLPQDGVYRPGRLDAVLLDEYRRLYCEDDKPTVAVLFYRAHWVSGNLEFVDAMLGALERVSGCNALPVFCSSLRDDDGAVFRKYLARDDGQAGVDVVICTQSFAMSRNRGPMVLDDADENWDVRILERLDVPVLQAIVSTEPQAMWDERDIGLSPLDMAMNVALPELDGRIITVPVSFKEAAQNGAASGDLRRYVPNVEQTESVASLAARYARLSHTPVSERKVAIVLSNYPTKAAQAWQCGGPGYAGVGDQPSERHA